MLNSESKNIFAIAWERNSSWTLQKIEKFLSVTCETNISDSNSFDLVRETVISLNIDFVIAIAQSSIPHNSEAGFVIAFDQGVGLQESEVAGRKVQSCGAFTRTVRIISLENDEREC